MKKILVCIVGVAVCLGCGSKPKESYINNSYENVQTNSVTTDTAKSTDAAAKTTTVGQYILKNNYNFVDIEYAKIKMGEKNNRIIKDCYVSREQLPINRVIYLFHKESKKAYLAKTGEVFNCDDVIESWTGNEIMIKGDSLPKSVFFYGMLMDTIKSFSVQGIDKAEETHAINNLNLDSLIRVRMPNLYSFVHRWDANIDDTLQEDTLNIEMEIRTIEGIDSLYFVNYFKCGKRDNYSSDLYLCSNTEVKILAEANAGLENAYIINDTIYIVIGEATPGTDAWGSECFQILKKPH